MKPIKWRLLTLALPGIIGFLVSAAMLVMAIHFGDPGRVVFYGVLAVVSAELTVLSVLRLRRNSQ